MNKEPNKRDLDFLYELGSLRNVQRGWRQHVGMDVANDLEHSLRVAWIAMILARMEGVKNDEKIIKMALVHDIAETRVSDLSYVQKAYATADEQAAADDLFRGTSLEDLNSDVLHEYKERKSIESKIVKDADNLDLDLEMRELEERGSQLPKKWYNMRKSLRDEKLYTESAKKLWDMIQDVDIDEWHISYNKFNKFPDAGR
ncbi:HD domain-containing protein [Patescibacteria group bacterium]|nr:HD domain-containing protein [Patescibacteria group bacterium]